MLLAPPITSFVFSEFGQNKTGMSCSLQTAELLLSIWTEQCVFKQLMQESMNSIHAVFQAYFAVST